MTIAGDAGGKRSKASGKEIVSVEVCETMRDGLDIHAVVPVIPESFKDWEYPKAVETVKGLVRGWSSVSAEVIVELYKARKMLGHQGARTDLKPGQTWESFCKETNISVRTANRLLQRYFPRNLGTDGQKSGEQDSAAASLPFTNYQKTFYLTGVQCAYDQRLENPEIKFFLMGFRDCVTEKIREELLDEVPEFDPKKVDLARLREEEKARVAAEKAKTRPPVKKIKKAKAKADGVGVAPAKPFDAFAVGAHAPVENSDGDDDRAAAAA